MSRREYVATQAADCSICAMKIWCKKHQHGRGQKKQKPEILKRLYDDLIGSRLETLQMEASRIGDVAQEREEDECRVEAERDEERSSSERGDSDDGRADDKKKSGSRRRRQRKEKQHRSTKRRRRSSSTSSSSRSSSGGRGVGDAVAVGEIKDPAAALVEKRSDETACGDQRAQTTEDVGSSSSSEDSEEMRSREKYKRRRRREKKRRKREASRRDRSSSDSESQSERRHRKRRHRESKEAARDRRTRETIPVWGGGMRGWNATETFNRGRPAHVTDVRRIPSQ